MDYRTKLSGLRRDDLNIIAKKLKIKNYRRGNKEQLINSILSTNNPEQIKKVISVSFWDRYHNHIYGITSVIGLIIAIISLPPVFRYYYPSQASQDSRKTPEVATPAAANSNESAPQLTQGTPATSPTPVLSPTPTVKSPAYPKSQKRESASIYIDRARALYGQGQYQGAIAACDKALRLEPNNKEALNLRKLIVEHMNRLKQQNI